MAKTLSDAFYRYKELHGAGGDEAHTDIYRRKPNRNNHVAREIETAVCDLAIDNPTLGQVGVNSLLEFLLQLDYTYKCSFS